MTIQTIRSEQWFTGLIPDLQQLILSSVELLQREKRLNSNLKDYSFILFPLSKAYEGVLKSFLFQQGLISEKVYLGRRFRIGRSLNPDIRQPQRDKWWLYDDVIKMCGEEIGRDIWDGWIECRNHIFHYFPNKNNLHSLPEIEKKVIKLIELMKRLMYCEIHH